METTCNVTVLLPNFQLSYHLPSRMPQYFHHLYRRSIFQRRFSQFHHNPGFPFCLSVRMNQCVRSTQLCLCSSVSVTLPFINKSYRPRHSKTTISYQQYACPFRYASAFVTHVKRQGFKSINSLRRVKSIHACKQRPL